MKYKCGDMDDANFAEFIKDLTELEKVLTTKN